MKRILLLVVLCVSTLSFSQKTIEKNLGDFNKLKVYDLIEVELIKANENKMLITGNNRDHVIINNKKGILKIKLRLESAFKGKDTKVTLYYKELDVIDANEGALVYSNDDIEQYQIDLKTQEGAKINVYLNVNYLNIKSVTGGNITASGTAKHQEVAIFTGGVYEGKLLKTNITNVSVNAAGVAHVNATNKATAAVRAGGNIYIYGHPKEIDESKFIGGKIEKVE